MTLASKVDQLRLALGIDPGLAMVDVILKSVRELNLGTKSEGLTLIAKADLCLATLQAAAVNAEGCPICLGELEAACRTPCNHVYCETCLRSSLKSWGAGACPLCRAPISLFSVRSVASDAPLRTPDVSTVFGLAFLQHGAVGVASYHFDAPDSCYISYAAAPPEWRLDEGSPPPQRKAFTSVAFDEVSRTFEGTILWDEETFGGAAKWVYSLTFSEDYNLICGGEMTSYRPDGTRLHERPRRFPQELVYWRQRPTPTTIAGTTFVQGGTIGLASYHFDEDFEASYISYEAAPPNWTQDDGAPMPGQKPFRDASYDEPSRTFRGVVLWEPPMHGDARWEYEMVFAEDFERITGGQVQAFGADGSPKETHRFGANGGLRYQRVVAERVQMQALLEAVGALRRD